MSGKVLLLDIHTFFVLKLNMSQFLQTSTKNSVKLHEDKDQTIYKTNTILSV